MDLRFAMLAAHVMAAATGKKQEYSDFMLFRDEEKPEAKVSLNELKSAFRGFMQAASQKKKDA